MGHTPFGHAGEFALDDILIKNFGLRFHHNLQSLRVVEVIEKNGQGLNLCSEILDGIKNHPSESEWPQTLEGKIVRLSDRFAYIRHDIEDAIDAKVIKKSDLPKKYMDILGNNILDTLVSDIIENSYDKPEIKLSPLVQETIDGLYDFMYKNVYTNPSAKFEEIKVPYLLQQLFRHYHYDEHFQKDLPESEQIQHTVDFIAGMTDRFAINKFQQLFVPNEWREHGDS